MAHNTEVFLLRFLIGLSLATAILMTVFSISQEKLIDQQQILIKDLFKDSFSLRNCQVELNRGNR